MTPRESRPEREGEESLAETLARLRPAFEGIRKACGIGVEEGQDVLQETLLRFARHRDEVRCREAWLWRTYRNECRRFLKKRASEAAALRWLETNGAPPRRELSPSRELLASEVVAPLDTLPRRERSLLRGFYLKGRGAESLAGVLGLKIASLKTTLTRARRRLGRKLGLG